MGKRSARCNHIVNGPPINLLGRVERRQAVPASEARCAGYPSVLAIGTEAPRSEGKGHSFEVTINSPQIFRPWRRIGCWLTTTSAVSRNLALREDSRAISDPRHTTSSGSLRRRRLATVWDML